MNNTCTELAAPTNPYERGTPPYVLQEHLNLNVVILERSRARLVAAHIEVDAVAARVNDFRVAIKAVTGKKATV